MAGSPGVCLPSDLPPNSLHDCCVAWTDTSYKHNVRTITSSPSHHHRDSHGRLRGGTRPLLSTPLLADTAAEAVDARTAKFLLQQTLAAKEEGGEEEAGGGGEDGSGGGKTRVRWHGGRSG